MVEVALALGITAFALVAILGLLSLGINHTQASIEQTTATHIATAIIADLRQTPTAAAVAANPSLTFKSPRYGVDVGSSSTTIYLDESGALQPSAAVSRYKAVITLSQPPAGERTATHGILIIGWPAAANAPLGAVTVFVALDRN